MMGRHVVHEVVWINGDVALLIATKQLRVEEALPPDGIGIVKKLIAEGIVLVASRIKREVVAVACCV